jgi:hypothetical protein
MSVNIYPRYYTTIVLSISVPLVGNMENMENLDN